jgi:hypothetical protein
MDLQKTIQELYAEKRRLEDAIASMEELLASKTSAMPLDLAHFRAKRRRGRRNMPPEERQRVSERMRKYWAQRRGNKAKAAAKSQV